MEVNMTRRMFASHPDWEEINAHQWLLIILMNPQLFFDGAALKAEIPELERNALVEKIKETIDLMLEGGIFRDFIESELDVTELNPGNLAQ